MVLPAEQPAPAHKPSISLVEELFTEARTEKRKRLREWGRYYSLTRNKSWSSFRDPWMPQPSSSEIYPTLDTLVAWMTDQRPRVFVSPSPDITELLRPPPPDLLTSLTRDMEQCIHTNWIRRGGQTETQLALWDCLVYGAGILKTGWDASLDFGRGDVVTRRIDPYAILPDPNATSFEDAQYVLEVRKVPFYELILRFGARAEGIPDDRGRDHVDARPRIEGGGGVVTSMMGPVAFEGAFPGTASPGVPAMHGRALFSGKDYTRSVLLKECWVRNTRVESIPTLEDGKVINREYQIPYWEYLAVAGGRVLNDDVSNPFEHGQLPYVRLPMTETGEFWSIPLVEHLARSQIALNRLLAALQLNAELTGHPILLEPEGSGIERTKMVGRPGQRVRYNPGMEPKWLQPPPMSPEVMGLVGFHRDTIDRASGVSAVSRGSALRRREPAQAVDAVQEASFVRIRKVLRNLEEALRKAAEQTASGIVQYYLEPRSIPKIGDTGSKEYLKLGVKHFWYPDTDGEQVDFVPLHFDVYMQAGSSLPISSEARAAQLMSLYFAGLIDPQTALEAQGVPNLERNLAFAQQMAELRAQGGEQQGHNPRKRRG